MNAGVVIFSVLFAFAAYREAIRFGKRYGRAPWGWPPVVWAVVCFLSWVIGIILLAIAERVGRKAAERQQTASTQAYAPTPGYVAPPFGDVTFGQPQPPQAMGQPMPNFAPPSGVETQS